MRRLLLLLSIAVSVSHNPWQAGEALATDYCGPEVRSILSKEMFLSAATPEVEFNSACETHDKCYRENASKVAKYMSQKNAGDGKKANFEQLVKKPDVAAKIKEEQSYGDSRFRRNVTRACERLNPVREAYCKGIDAKIYPLFLRKYGQNWFMRAVREQYTI